MVRNLNIPLQNDGMAILPVPMTPADHALLTTILEALKAVHVRELPPESNTCAAAKLLGAPHVDGPPEVVEDDLITPNP